MTAKRSGLSVETAATLRTVFVAVLVNPTTDALPMESVAAQSCHYLSAVGHSVQTNPTIV